MATSFGIKKNSPASASALKRRLAAPAFALALLVTSPSYAACTSPAGNAGDVMYSSVQNVMAYCNGTSWVNMGTTSSVSFGSLVNGAFCTAVSTTQITCTTSAIDLTSQVTGILPPTKGGTGVNNGANTLTLAGPLATAGGYGITFNTTGTTNVTLPTSGTLLSTAGVGTITNGTWNGDIITVPYGGTGLSSFTTNVLYKGNGTGALQPSSLTDNGTTITATGNISASGKSYLTEIANDASTGTTLNKLVKLTSSGTAILTTSTDTDGVIGIAVGNAGTSGNVQIAVAGQAACVFDGATTAGHYVTLSATVAGDCTDGGATRPSTAQSLGRVLSSNASGGAYQVAVGLGGKGGLPAGTTGQVQYNDGTGNFGATANFIWDNTNQWLGIGTTTPGYTVDASVGTVAAKVVHVGVNASSMPVSTSLSGVVLNNATTGQLAYYSGVSSIAGSPALNLSGSNLGIGTTTVPQALTVNGNVDVLSGKGYAAEIANEGTTGTTVNKLAKLSNTGTAVISATTDTDGILGIVIGGAGTTGNAQIAESGQASCIFDGATTAGHYVAISTTVAGDCTDAGASRSATTQTIGRVLSTNASGGTYVVTLSLSKSAGSEGAVTGTGTANYVTKWATATTLGTGVIYDNGTNVGVGTTVPTAPLEVYANTANGLAVVGSSTNSIGIRLSNSAGHNWSVGSSGGGAGAAGNLVFWDNTIGGPRVTIDASGLVGIGTTEPTQALTVTGNVDVWSGKGYASDIANDATNGTTINKLAKLTSTGAAVISATTDTDGVLGIVIGGAGTTGNAQIAASGQASCVFDGATTAGHYVAISTSVAGDCTDAGASRSATTQTIGRVLSTNASGGVYTIAFDKSSSASNSGGATIGTSGGAANYTARWLTSTAIGTGVLYDNGTGVGIGTTAPVGLLNLRGYTGGTGVSAVAAYTKTLEIGGAYNQTYNSGNAVLLHIADYSNDAGDNVYPIYVEDENNNVAFYINGGVSATAGTAYFGGNVGIGTTTPIAGLQVVTAPAWSSWNVGANILVSGALNNAIGFLDSTGANPWAIGSLGGATTGAFSFYKMPALGNTTTAPTSIMTLAPGGNVGIGTTSPASKLHVYGGEVQVGSSGTSCSSTVGGAVRFSGTSLYYCDGSSTWQTIAAGTATATGGSGTANYTARWTGATTLGTGVLYDNGTNVGIGTTAPTYNLDVWGTGANTARIASSTSGLNYLDVTNTNTGTTSNGSVIRLITENVAGSGSVPVDIVKYANGSFYINNNETNAAAYTAFAQSGAERMRITSTGNVGIGTTAPGYTLDVAGTVRLTGAGLYNSAGYQIVAGNQSDWLRINQNASWPSGVAAYSNWAFGSGGVAIGGWTNPGAGNLTVTGNVGIGTTGPLSKLDVLSSGSELGNGDVVGSSGNFEGSTPSGQGSTLSLTGNDAVAANIGGVLGFGGNYNGSQYANWASIKGLKADATSGNYGGYLAFYTRLTGSGSAERMRIDTSGNVGIGTTAPTAPLDVRGAVRVATTDFALSSAGSVFQILEGTSTGNTYTSLESLSSGGTAWNSIILQRGGGNVGIGTAAPGRKLDVSTGSDGITFGQDADNSQTIQTYIDGTWATRTTYASGCCNTLKIQTDVGATIFGGAVTINANATGAASLTVNGSEVVTGNVGIGTTTPSYALDVTGQGRFQASIPQVFQVVGVGTGYADATNGIATFYSQSTTGSGGNVIKASSAYAPNAFIVKDSGAVGIGTATPNATFSLDAWGPIRTASSISNVEVYLATGTGYGIIQAGTAANSSTLPLAINPQGSNVGIGTTAPSLSLDIWGPGTAGTGVVKMRATNSPAGQSWSIGPDSANNMIVYNQANTGVYMTNGGTTWNANSDFRLKKNVLTYSVLDKLADYRAVSFDWKSSGRHEIGVIAQELYRVFPELVIKGDDDPNRAVKMGDPKAWGVSYDRLGALSLQGIKELKTLFDGENSKIDAQAKQIEELKVMIEQQHKDFEAYKKTHP